MALGFKVMTFCTKSQERYPFFAGFRAWGIGLKVSDSTNRV